MDSLEMIYIAPSLGGVETLITHPATVTYYRYTRELFQIANANNQLFALFLHQAIIDCQVRLTFTAVNDQCFDREAQAHADFVGSREHRPAHTDNAGLLYHR